MLKVHVLSVSDKCPVPTSRSLMQKTGKPGAEGSCALCFRQVSGANIKISNAEDGSADRKVTITGTPDTIGLAQYLISTRLVQQSYYAYPVAHR